MATQEEDLKDGLGPAKHLLEDTAHADRSPEKSHCVSEILDEGILLPELGKKQARVRRQRADDADEDDARHETHGCQNRGQ